MTAPHLESQHTAAARPARRLAYLLSSYPAISHTFFLNEVIALRTLGFEIDVASINTPKHPPGGLPARETAESESTFYVKSTRKLSAILLVLKILFVHPKIFLRGLTFSLSLSRWNLKTSLYSLFYFVEALIVGDWMRARGQAHLHIHFGGPVATVGMIVSAAWRIPYSLMIHGPEEFFDIEKTGLIRKVERATFILCISDFCRSQLMRISSPQDWDKFHVVRLGVDPELFQSQQNRIDSQRIEILCVGRLVPDKGQLILLRALVLLLERAYPLRLRFVGDGSDRPRLEEFIRENDLSSHVILDGALDHNETRRRLNLADIFVLPSFAEGVPVALMEAMAMEIPCISTYVGGIPELIESGVSGILVPPSSPELLANAIESLVLNQDLRREIGSAARTRVLKLYNLPVNIVTLAEQFESHLR